MSHPGWLLGFLVMVYEIIPTYMDWVGSSYPTSTLKNWGPFSLLTWGLVPEKLGANWWRSCCTDYPQLLHLLPQKNIWVMNLDQQKWSTFTFFTSLLKLCLKDLNPQDEDGFCWLFPVQLKALIELKALHTNCLVDYDSSFAKFLEQNLQHL